MFENRLTIGLEFLVEMDGRIKNPVEIAHMVQYDVVIVYTLTIQSHIL